MAFDDRFTKTELHKLENRLSEEYRKAYASMYVKAQEYFDKYDDRYWTEYAKYKNGEYTDSQFQAWVQTQISRGKGWEKVKRELANSMVSTNVIAAAYINGTTPDIYAVNANYTAYSIYKDYPNINFQLVDENTVKNLITESGNFTEFKRVHINKARDYEWNSRQIQSALISGIIQGHSIDEMAKSFLVVMQRNENSAIRNARTACTSAENAGRQTMLEQAKEKGIDVRKKWVSGHDGRVRDSHAHLDGQIRDIDKPFDNGLMYPADSSGAPAEVYNCRCTLTYVYPKYQPNEKSVERYQEYLEKRKKATAKENKNG